MEIVETALQPEVGTDGRPMVEFVNDDMKIKPNYDKMDIYG